MGISTLDNGKNPLCSLCHIGTRQTKQEKVKGYRLLQRIRNSRCGLAGLTGRESMGNLWSSKRKGQDF